ncbi:MAG TPA: hypothetical protein VLI06_12435 [Solimonas sp.]|nr:hypothetical protein [Solimonas sp.]
MISILACARLLRRLFDFSAETGVLERELPGCSGFGPASYGIPVAPVWLPQATLRQPAESPEATDRPT